MKDELLMTTAKSPVDLIAVRARREFPGHRVDAIYPVCWPVYRVRLTVTTMAQVELATTAHYILRLVDLGPVAATELARQMGLPEKYILGAAADMLRDDLLTQRPADLRIAITDKGKQAIADDGKAISPQTKPMEIPFDPLTRKVVDLDTGDLLHRDRISSDGLYLVQYVGAKPKRSDLRFEEIKSYNANSPSEDRIEEDIIEVSEVRRGNARLQYRNDIFVAKLNGRNSNDTTFAAFRGHEYLEDESTVLQRLAQKGVSLTPGEFEDGDSVAPGYSPLASSEERSLITDIDELGAALDEGEQDATGLERSLAESLNDAERHDLAKRIEEVAEENRKLRRQLADAKADLNRQTDGKVILIDTEQHHPLLLQAIDRADFELTLVSAWIGPRAFDGEVQRKVADAIRRDVKVRIAWGLGVDQRGPEAQRNLRKGEKVLERLRNLIPRNMRDNLIVKRTATHQKFIICDDKFCASGSFNWLSYRGVRDEGYRRETSALSFRQDDVTMWRDKAGELFG